MHEKVPHLRPLYYCFGSDKMSARSNGNTSALVVLDLLTCAYEFPKIVELACSVGISKDNILSSGMPHPMCNGASLATVLEKRNKSNRSGRDVDCSFGAMCPWSRLATGSRRELMVLSEV